MMDHNQLDGKHETNQEKRGRRFRLSLSLGKKIILGVILLTFILSGISLYIGAYIHRRLEVNEHMSDTWKTASTASCLLDAMDAYKYIEEVLRIYEEEGGRELSQKYMDQLNRYIELSISPNSDPAAVDEAEQAVSESEAQYVAAFRSVFSEEFNEINEKLDEIAKKNNLTEISVLAIDKEKDTVFTVFGNSFYQPDKDWQEAVKIGAVTPMETYTGLEEYYKGGSQGQYSFDYNMEGSSRGTVFSSIAPYENPETGELIAYIDAFEIWDAGNEEQKGYVLNYLLGILVVAVLFCVAVNFLTRNYIVRPIRKLSGAAISFAQSKDKEGQNYFRDLGIRTGDEIQTLGEAMEQLEGDLHQYMAELTQISQEKERVGAELRMATRIQASMLPNEFPPFPDRQDFDIYGSMQPAREVGGDFYDYFLIDDQHLALLIADVSDKGVPAALFMMATMLLIQYRIKLGGTPSEILDSVNRQICGARDKRRTKMFVTVWLGILDLSDGTLLCSNAGHEFPVIRRGNGAFQIYKDKHCFVVGGLERAKYRDYELKLEKGDAIFVYTDGIPEAGNTKKEFYGLERLEEALAKVSNRTPKEIVESVRSDVEAFADGAEQSDDITMLCLEYSG